MTLERVESNRVPDIRVKDLEGKVSFALIFEGHIGDFFKGRKWLEENLENSRPIFCQFSSQAYFAVNWHDLNQEKQLQIKEGKLKRQKQ